MGLGSDVLSSPLRPTHQILGDILNGANIIRCLYCKIHSPSISKGGIECLAYFQLFSEGLGSEKNILGNAELVLPLGFILFYSAPPPFI